MSAEARSAATAPIPAFRPQAGRRRSIARRWTAATSPRRSPLLRERIRPLALLDQRFVLLVVQVGDIDPRVSHLVDRPIAVADPLIGIRIELVRLRVVMPGEDVNDRPF